MYQDGFLPEDGGINHQPALLIEYFACLKVVHGKLDKEDLDKNNPNADSNEGGMKSLLR